MKEIRIAFNLCINDDVEHNPHNRLTLDFVKNEIDRLGATILEAFDETIHDVEIKDYDGNNLLTGEKAPQPIVHSEIEDQVIEIITEELGVEETEISLDTDIYDDWNCDSLDDVEIVMALEEKFGIKISDNDCQGKRKLSEIIHMVEEIIEKNYPIAY